jgi:hypothetical protein
MKENILLLFISIKSKYLLKTYNLDKTELMNYLQSRFFVVHYLGRQMRAEGNEFEKRV